MIINLILFRDGLICFKTMVLLSVKQMLWVTSKTHKAMPLLHLNKD